MKSILWLAPYVPYEKVKHAGGKNMNYYINYVNQKKIFDITFIGLAYEEERQYVDLDSRGIKADIYYRDNSKLDSIIRRIFSGFTLVNPFTPYYRQVLFYERVQLIKRVKKFKAQGDDPDIIVLHWTAMGLLIHKLKSIFPNSKYIIIEEDVSYLGYERKYKHAKGEGNILKKLHWKRYYKGLKNAELKAISESNYTLVLNKKDEKLLLKDGVNKQKLLLGTVYFTHYTDVKRKPKKGNIIYYGAMDRIENYESAIWFIDNVWPLFEKDANLNGKVKLYIVGAKPNQKLIDRQSQNIIVTGFVDDIREYFENAMCLVAPLLIGAGIKVKVLEAMSSGLTVLTNEIGIEGIDAVDRESYLYCSEPSDYYNCIKEITFNEEINEKIGLNGQHLIETKYNSNQLLEQFVEILKT